MLAEKSPHRSARHTAVAASHCRERRTTRTASPHLLAIESFEGETLGIDDLHRIKESVIAALALGDHGHIQLVMADLRVRNPKGWVEVDRVLRTLRAYQHTPPRTPVSGLGSFSERPAKIERNVHRFWPGGPLPAATKAKLLAMQEVVAESAGSGTPWTQYLWTSDAKSVAELATAGVEIVDVDPRWDAGRARLVSVGTYGGVYLDASIAPGTLDLRNHQLHHTDRDGEIGHHAPPFRTPRDYTETVGDASLGDSPRERIVRRADASLPIADTLFASRSGTRHVEAALQATSPFSRLFVPHGERRRTTYAPPQQRVTPWAADLDWFS